MEFPPNSSASEPISHNKTVMSPCSRQGFFIGQLERTMQLRRQENQAETQSSRTEQNYSLLREIAQH